MKSAAQFEFEGRMIGIQPGDTLASALYRAGVRIFSRSFKYHRPRGLYCLSGDCPHCLLTVDGEPGTRACQTPALPGLRVQRENAWPSPDADFLSVIWYLRALLPVGFYYKWMVHPRIWAVAEPIIRRLAGSGRVPQGCPPRHREICHQSTDLLVVGGGAAGLAAALAAAEDGHSVLLVDEGIIGAALAPGPVLGRIEFLAGRLREHPSVRILEQATAVGCYEGPLVPVVARDFVYHVHPRRIIVATGAVEYHPLFPGNDLPGVLLGRGAARLAGVHGLLGGSRVVFAGSGLESVHHLSTLLESGVQVAAAIVPESLAAELPPQVPRLSGRVVAARGRNRLKAVVVETEGCRQTISCDLLVASLGLIPRDSLLRQAGSPLVSGAGDAVLPGCSLEEAIESGRKAAQGGIEVPRPQPFEDGPEDGFLCPCEDVTRGDLEYAWEEGFQSTELLKRYCTVTMGPCQGALCHHHLQAFVQARTPSPQWGAATTARPPARPVRLEDISAGLHQAIEKRTRLHHRHLQRGAQMEWAGEWRRPQTYGDSLQEYWAVRRNVSIMDVGTLGKFLLAGPDVLEFLEKLYPCHVHDIRPGHLRYSLLLNEAGHVIDDGLICPLGAGRYYLTCTTAAAAQSEAWFRDWAEAWRLEVHIVNQTDQLGAVNVAGPRARDLLSACGSGPLDAHSFPHGCYREMEVAGVPCRVLRVGFVGELSFELHHPSSQSERLWDALLSPGPWGEVLPHGLDALRVLRLEKGHILIGQDTDFDTTPAKIGMNWAVKMNKAFFLGQAALSRIASRPLEQRLVPIAFRGGEAPLEGAALSSQEEYAGYLTSSRLSPALGHGVALGWVRGREGSFPETVKAGQIEGEVVRSCFYDPKGERLRA